MSRTLIAAVVLALASPAFAEDKKPEPKGEPVTGKITFNDKALPAGTITFVSKDGKSYAATIAADGTYAATLPAGEYRIGVSTTAVKKGDPKNYVPIPAKYGDPDTSGLVYSVAKGKQTYDIALK
jgi:hypothetical protein